MKLTMDEAMTVLAALNDRNIELSKASLDAEAVDQKLTADMWKEEAEKAKALREKLIANLDELVL